jgi:TP901 family phage tail tape measure protein
MRVTLPIVGIAAASVKTAATFETSMNMLQASSGASKKQMKALEDQAIQLGASTVFSANDAADAMLELGRAGFNSAQISKAVPQVMNLAATEGLELGNAAGIVSSALSQFNIKAGESAKVVNALAGASNASRSSVATLSESFKLVGPAAHNIGLSVQETAAALAALSQGGLDGSIAGTSLASVFNHLVPATTKAKDAMKSLNLDFTDSKGRFDDIDTIAGKLRKSFKGMSEEQKKINLRAIFGNDASVISAVSALIQEGAGGLQKYTKAANNQSAAQKLADARMKGTQGAIEKMKGALETAALVIGKALAPIVVSLAGFIADLAAKFSNLSPDVQKFILIGAGIAAVLGPVLIIVGALIGALGTIAGVFAGVSLAVLAPIAAIALLGVGLFLLFKRSKAARDVVIGAFNEIKVAILPAIQGIVDMVTQQLIPAFEMMWPILEKIGVIVLKIFAGAVVGAIKGAIQVIEGIVQVITGVVQVVSGILTGDWAKVWEGVKNIVGGALDVIIGALKVWLNVGILKVFRLGFGLLTGLIRGSWGVIRGLFTTGTGALKSILGKVANILLAPFRIGFNALKALITLYWNIFKALFTTGFSVLKALVTGNFGALKGIFSGALGAIRTIFFNGLSALRGIMKGAWDQVRGAVTGGVTSAVNVIRGLPGKAAGVLKGIGSVLVSAGVELIAGFLKGILSKFDDVKDTLGNLTGKLTSWKGPESKDKSLLIKSGEWIIEGFVKGLQKGEDGVRAQLKSLTDRLRKFGEKEAVKIAKGFADRLIPMGKALDKVGRQLEAAQDKLTEKLEEMRSYAKGVGESLIESVFGPGTEEVPPSFDNIIASLQQQEAQAQAFAAVLKQLKNLGLNTTSYDQIATQGPEALAAAQALIASGQAGVDQVNALQGSINQYASQAGETAAQYLYGAGIRTAEGIVEGLEKDKEKLERQMKHLGNVLADAITAAVNETIKGIHVNTRPPKGHASGVMSSSSGWSMVGERGRELVRLPEGSRVYPAHQTERLTTQTVDSSVKIDQNFYGPTTSGGRLREMEWTMRYATKARAES